MGIEAGAEAVATRRAWQQGILVVSFAQAAIIEVTQIPEGRPPRLSIRPSAQFLETSQQALTRVQF
jgi:hypothetical protein